MLQFGCAEVLPPDDEEECLSRLLFETMERLDPTEDGDFGWEGLTEDRRDFYRTSTRALLAYSGRPTTTK